MADAKARALHYAAAAHNTAPNSILRPSGHSSPPKCGICVAKQLRSGVGASGKETLDAADVVALGAKPNGTNINADCGSTCPSVISDAVKPLRCYTYKKI